MADPIQPENKPPAGKPPLVAPAKVQGPAPKPPAEAAPVAPESDGSHPYPVKAIAVGYFGGGIKTYGAVFNVESDQDFATWMEPVNQVDKVRLAARMKEMQRGRTQPAPPGTKPTPATRLV